MDIESITSALAIIRNTFRTIKTAKELIPNSQDKNQIEENLEKAENEIKVVESKIAKELGYQICKCSWPPEIMLSIGQTEYAEKFQCPKCKNIWPPNEPPLNDNWRTI